MDINIYINFYKLSVLWQEKVDLSSGLKDIKKLLKKL